MAKNLWQLRKQKGLTAKQLAGKAGISLKELEAYENGAPVRTLHRHRLAKVLFVDAVDIKVQSDPKPTPKPKATPNLKSMPKPASAPQPAPTQKTPQSPKLARPGQIEHLLAMSLAIGEDEAVLTAKISKPMSELTLFEAKQWLGEYHQLMRERKAQRPPGTRRSHVPLPEEVDEFELKYLQARQENGESVMFNLFDGTTLTGQVIGFSPFSITIRQADGTETAIQKLALAYYSVQQEGGA